MMILAAWALAAASGSVVQTERPVDDAVALCVNAVARSREVVHPRALGFEPAEGANPKRSLPGGGWMDVMFSKDAEDGTLHCTLGFDGDQDDIDVKGAVRAAVDRLGLNRVSQESTSRYHTRKVEDQVATTYDGVVNGRRVVIVHRWASKVPGNEAIGRDSIHVFAPAASAPSKPAESSRRR